MRSAPYLVAAALIAAPLLLAQPSRPVAPAPDLVPVPAGPFLMGSDAVGEPDEWPRHTVDVPAFSIDRTEVPRSAYDRCVRAGACREARPLDARFERPTLPVVGVSWHQARAYCAWAGRRLPTEEEWEKAARGTDGRTYPWGETYPTNALAVFGRAEATGSPDPVGSHPRGASPYGALDLAGNVWEWVESPYDPYAYRHPQTPPTCETALQALHDLRAHRVRGFTGANPLPTTCERVLRGGGWNYGGAGLRSANRVHHAPNFRLVMSGFRCAVSGVVGDGGVVSDAGVQ
ncbi:MAG: SUMF1/EgtB/PvdO family nonheme iron enzyme [Deltaproteobacteria bacterium]|nr:SUMF1/EgtB/PvdO family nonheme iron enzyme [Deltaproteobacteria bacterium]